MAYATVNENTLYVHGGRVYPELGGSFIRLDQFYSLDLTKGWDDITPPWKAIADPASLGLITNYHSMTVSPDGQTLITVWITGSSPLLATYNIQTGKWSQTSLAGGRELGGVSFQAAADPTTGLMYIPGAGVLGNNDVIIYNFATGLTTRTTIPSSLVAVQGSYSFIWNQVRKSFILFAGNPLTANPFFEYSPSTGRWSTLVSSIDRRGDLPKVPFDYFTHALDCGVICLLPISTGHVRSHSSVPFQ
jgi:hypothetical protein